jgi:proteic killer suppression protein
MPRKFADRRTERFAHGVRISAFSATEREAEGRLQFLLNPESLQDVGVMPRLRLERLQGDRQGQWSIRINDQWRICFVWDDSVRQAFEIEIVDYH